MPSFDQVIVWIVVGMLGGSLAALAITRERKGYGVAQNLALGLVGALVGGLLFRLTGLWPGLDKVSISLRDIVSAVVGSLIVLAALWAWRRCSTGRHDRCSAATKSSCLPSRGQPRSTRFSSTA